LTAPPLHLGNICIDILSKCSPNFPLSLHTRRLFSSLLFRFDLSLHFYDQYCEFFLAFLSRLCVDVPRDTLTVGVGGCEPPFVEAVVDHGNATRATLADLLLQGSNFISSHSIFSKSILTTFLPFSVLAW